MYLPKHQLFAFKRDFCTNLIKYAEESARICGVFTHLD